MTSGKKPERVQPDRDPSHIPATDRPRRNSQLYNEVRKEGEAVPEDYPVQDRRDGNVATDHSQS